MSQKPTVPELDTCLKKIVENWVQFALHLPGVDLSDIDIIKKDVRGVVERKTALYKKWLKVYPDASWNDVVAALEEIEENTIAKEVRDKYLYNNEKSPSKEISPNEPVLSMPSSDQSCEVDEVLVSEEVVKELNTLHRSFLTLTQDVKKEVESRVEKRKLSTKAIVRYIQEERSCHIANLQTIQTTDDLFNAIHPHYNFLNFYLMVSITIQFLSGLIVKKAKEYEEQIEKFKKTTQIKYLKNALKKYFLQTRRRGCNTTKVIIEVENLWGGQQMWLVEMLVKILFPASCDELHWYEISPGSLNMTFTAFEHKRSSLIESGRKKIEFMRLVGVISLKIGDELVWRRENKAVVRHFEDSLIQATLAGNIEAVQFLLQYTQVDVNTMNTNSTLINIDEEIYSSELHIGRKLRSFQASFKSIYDNVVIALGCDLHNHVNVPRDDFLNGRKLAEIQLLPQEQSTEIQKYIKMVDGFKRLFLVHYLKKSLLNYFPTKFPNSIEVIITLHSMWSTCSVWYVEQLGQLIFTPTLFYQLQWFRVDKTEQSMSVCLLGDEKMKKNLEECISTNKLRTSMLGVMRIMVADTEIIANKSGEGYTFYEAIEIAKQKGDRKILNLLEQIWQSPVDYRDLTTLDDDNSNHCFVPHPDSNPLMIACCHDNSQLVELLLEKGADPNLCNGRGVTALMYSTGNLKIFQMLLDHRPIGANINAITSYSITAMHFACAMGNEKVVEILISKNSSLVHQQDDNGRTPLFIVSGYGHTTVVESLLKAKADPSTKNSEGWTALEVASRYGFTTIVQKLLQAEVDPNDQDNEGRTALEVASRYGHIDVVKELLHFKADPDIRDNKGRTPLLFAIYANHEDVVDFLKKEGAFQQEDELIEKDLASIQIERNMLS